LESNPDGELSSQLIFVFYSIISTNPLNVEALIALGVTVVLLVASATVSGAEVAFFSLSSSHIGELKETESKNHERILNLLHKPRTLLATILIANNLFNIGIIVTSYYIISSVFHFDQPLAKFVTEVLLVTFVIVIFGEVVPKVYANHSKMNFARFAAPILFFLRKVFLPASKMLVESTRFIEKRLQQKNGKGQVTKEEIDHAIELARDDSTSSEEIDILKGIVKFSDIAVKQIMRSRVDIVAIEKKLPFNKVLDKILESGYSRFPVFDENLDRIEGFLYAKDLLKYLDYDDTFDWSILIREPFFVPENKRIEELLREFQQKHIHLAIAVDEYGGTSGIITLEDIMEEIIGEIEDEYDVGEEISYQQVDSHTFVFEGKTLINDFCKVMDIDSAIFDQVKGDADSLAGLLLELFQKIPAVNETITYNKYSFEVLSVTRRRIQKVKITELDHD
jgi:gliding motility-associated protein GldE